MCFFDSPIARCEQVREVILLDETQEECAREHSCPLGRVCPLEGCFTMISGLDPEDEKMDAVVRNLEAQRQGRKMRARPYA